MRKIKSTALLGAFVAVASVGAISHEAHGAQLSSIANTISKEILPNSVTLPAPYVTPGVSYPSNSQVQITLTLNGATFPSSSTYTIENTSCSTTGNGTNSITFANSTGSYFCSLTAGISYTIVTGTSGSFIVNVPQTSNSVVLSYSSDVTSNTGNDSSSAVTLATVQQQLSFAPISSSTYYINPSSLSMFTNNGIGSATNSVVLSNNAFGISTWSNTIGTNNTLTSYTMNFVFTGIPGSVSTVNGSLTPVNGSVTVSVSLTSYPGTVATAPFVNNSSTTISFNFSNSGNSSISIGSIVLSSIVGSGTNSSGSIVNYPYLSTPTNFINFAYSGVQIYIPDALAPYEGNAINAGYITISMPSSTDIASVSILNIPGASCPTPSTSNGLLFQSATGLYVIDLGKLAGQCTGLTSGEWQAGVPLVINLSGSNVSPNNITADAYAVYNNGVNNGGLKRIPVVIVSNGSGMSAFSY